MQARTAEDEALEALIAENAALEAIIAENAAIIAENEARIAGEQGDGTQYLQSAQNGSVNPATHTERLRQQSEESKERGFNR